jgi:NAD(P)-dependent dehydrogenase (short-subunit alcohol dehydrogenase family)
MAGDGAYLPSARLDGRAVLVTGGGRGLGQGIALGLVEAGASVVAVSRTASELAETIGRSPVPGGVRAVPWDVTDLASLDALVAAATAEAGPLHGVIHAAGAQHREDADAFTPEDWRRVVAIQLEAPFFLSTALHRAQVAAGGGGSHVFIGSLTSSIGLPRMAAYGAAKSGVLGVVRALSVEWARGGTRVNAIAPGYFHTRLTEALLADPAAKARIDARIPMGRLGTARDLAGVAAFLLSDAAAYITGQVIAVDGGWLAA